MGYVIWLVNLIFQLATLLIIVKVILSYFMEPYHPVRMTIDRIVNPFLEPIRRIVPAVGMLDFSPIVLLIILQILNALIVNGLRAVS